jgi:NAD(P)-dependent dehydrogenase (short-subunit alcohol dehydrogenase family)
MNQDQLRSLFDLTGRVAIVTGGTRGIGRAIAEGFVASGARVAVASRKADACDETEEALRAMGGDAIGVPTHLGELDSLHALVERTVDDFGRLDIVVNNAGISRVGPHTQDVTDEDWHDSIAVMQTGVFYCMRAAGRIMVPQRSGSVVNISSIRGFSPNPGRMTYSTPKAAVIMMTKVAAGEWAPFGVRVNAIAPGVLRTPMWDADVARGAIDEQHYLDVVPAHRLGEPREVGRLVVYLCSDDAEYITGSVLTIDGALTSIPAA